LAKIKIGGIIQHGDLALIQILGLPPASQAVAAVLEALGGRGVNVPVVVQSHGTGRRSNMAFAVSRPDLERAMRLVRSVCAELGAEAVESTPEVGFVAVFGPHFRDRPAIAGTMFAALATAGLDLLAITTSISTVACLIREADLPHAVAVLEETFELP
jgi:aspartate kinase